MGLDEKVVPAYSDKLDLMTLPYPRQGRDVINTAVEAVFNHLKDEKNFCQTELSGFRHFTYHHGVINDIGTLVSLIGLKYEDGWQTGELTFTNSLVIDPHIKEDLKQIALESVVINYSI